MNCNSDLLKKILTIGLLSALIFASCSKRANLKPPVVVIKSASDIIPIANTDSIIPVLYNNEQYRFRDQTIEANKKNFIDMLLPSVLIVKNNLDQDFHLVDNVLSKLHRTGRIDSTDSIYLNNMQLKLEASDWWDARRRLITHPPSIVLAQAAIESGWGSSRFFSVANNLFGVWSYDPKEPRIQSLTSRDSGPVYLRSYSNVAESIYDYYDLIARVSAYKGFRRERYRTNQPDRLVHQLSKYSELRVVYVRKLIVVMKQNNLYQYDSASLAPEYIGEDGYISF